MNSSEISGLLKGLAFVALGYVLCLHHQAAKCGCKNAGGQPPSGNTGIVPPGYNPATHDYTTSMTALLQGVV